MGIPPNPGRLAPHNCLFLSSLQGFFPHPRVLCACQTADSVAKVACDRSSTTVPDEVLIAPTLVARKAFSGPSSSHSFPLCPLPYPSPWDERTKFTSGLHSPVLGIVVPCLDRGQRASTLPTSVTLNFYDTPVERHAPTDFLPLGWSISVNPICPPPYGRAALNSGAERLITKVKHRPLRASVSLHRRSWAARLSVPKQQLEMGR